MDLLTLIQSLFFDYTLRTVALGSAILGLISGALGSFAVLRRQSLLGDAISHAALPGVVIAFLLTRTKAPLIMVIGASVSGWLATLFVMAIIRKTRIKEDTALGLVLSVFFGIGMMLLTYTQRLPDARQAGLDHFLFGQAAALLESDVVTMALLGATAISLLFVFWKEFKLLSFDPEFGASLGFRIGALDILLTTLFVIAIVIGLQAVGVVLMSAMVVAPAAAARQWTDRLSVMVLLAGALGAASGVIGTLASSQARGLSTGPTIVLTATALAALSFLLAPNRGLIWNWARRMRNRRQLRIEAVMSDLYVLAGQHDNEEHPHSLEVLRAMSAGQGGVRRSLQVLAERGWAVEKAPDEWALTGAGRQEAEKNFNRQNPRSWSGGTA